MMEPSFRSEEAAAVPGGGPSFGSEGGDQIAGTLGSVLGSQLAELFQYIFPDLQL
jgi:hypothetical protein